MAGNKKNQARLRLVVNNGSGSTHLSTCRSRSSTAASPLGSEVRPCSMSLTDCADKPMREPISESFRPVLRRSVTRDAQVVMPTSIREPVLARQRQSVTGFRDNLSMPRPHDLPEFNTIGARVRWWRLHRKMTQKQLAKRSGLTAQTISDLENERQVGSGNLHLIAAALGLKAHYIDTDQGEPELGHADEPPVDSVPWPFTSVPPKKLISLNKIELQYAETKLANALDDIEVARRTAKRQAQ